MWLLDIIIQSAAVALLAVYLVFSTKRRQLDLPPSVLWNGRAFCAGPVSRRVQQLRQNYLAGLPARTHSCADRRRRLASAQQVLGQRAYFRSIKASVDLKREVEARST